MVNFKEIIDASQDVLHDADDLFSREELLNWGRDGLRLIASQAGALRTFKAYDVPPRHSYGITYEWERRYVDGGSFRKFTFSHETARLESTSLFEVPLEGDITTTPGLMNVSQLWELARAGEKAEANYRLYLTKSETHVKAIWWDHKRLNSSGLQWIDNLQNHWWRVEGDPYEFVYLGRNHTVDIYEIVTEYHQAYAQKNIAEGMPTDISGTRTYTVSSDTHEWQYAYTNGFEVGEFSGLGYRITKPSGLNELSATNSWEIELATREALFSFDREVGTAASDIEVTLGTGAFRGGRSSERQYVAEEQWSLDGICRSFGSSEEAFLVLYGSLPFPEDVNEHDKLDMLPGQLGKYLRFYILAKAFNRQGEGYDPSLAAFYEQRFSRAIRLMRKLQNSVNKDASYSRSPSQRMVGRVPQPQLPSDFPRAPWL